MLSSLSYAAMKDHDDIIELLLNWDAAVTPQALVCATSLGQVSTIKLLFHCIEEKDKSGLLCCTALFGHVHVVEQSVGARADADSLSHPFLPSAFPPKDALSTLPFATGFFGRRDKVTALVWAAFGGHAPIVSFLASHEANVNIKNRYGWTPLMVAAHFEDPDLTRILLQKSIASIDVPEYKDGRTALFIAVDNGHDPILKR